MRDDEIELACLACLLWGPRDQADTTTIDVDAFADRTTAALVAAAIERADVRHLWDTAKQAGITPEDLTERVTYWLPPRQREGLAYYVDRLHEAADRRVLEAELVRLAHALHAPGGPDRVRARLVNA